MAIQIIDSSYTPEQAVQLFGGTILTRQFAKEHKFKLVHGDAEFRTPDGSLIAKVVTDVFDEAEQKERYEVWKHLPNDLRNRPEVFGTGARQELLRVDGETPTGRQGVASSLIKLAGGGSVSYGPYRYKNSAPGVPDCRLTATTLKRSDLFLRAMQIGLKVDELYRAILPIEHARQMEYVDTILPDYKIRGTGFTTFYGIDKPTAVHIDEFDIPTATGVMTTAGFWAGGEFCLPEFGLVFDLQPDSILFVDVHRWHGNLPRIWGHRVSQIYFVRKGMHECGLLNGAIELTGKELNGID